MLFFVWNVTKSRWKQSIVMHHFLLITGVHTLTIEHTIFFVMTGLIVEVLLSCSSFVALCNGLKCCIS